MLRAFDANGRFVAYGTYIQWDSGATYGAFPDDAEAVKDDAGNELVAAKRSVAYGFKLCPLHRPDLQPFGLACVASDAHVCTVGDPDDVLDVLGFVCWHVASRSSCRIRFAQCGDPRLNGAPVLHRKSKTLVGVYMVNSWTEETKAECVPCDLLANAPIPGWDPRRQDVEAEIAAGWGEEAASSLKIPRAIEINDWVFAESYDHRAKWVTHVFADREFVYEDECRYLMDPFADVVRKIESGERQLRWSNGAPFDIVGSPRGVGFAVQARRAPLRADEGDAATEDGSFACVEWY